MADRVYPSGKPSAATGAAFPATKAQLYNASRPAYRPIPPPSSRRRLFRSCCLWTTLVLFVLFLLAAVSLAALYLIYSPRRPSFSLSALKISRFNLSSNSHLSSAFSLSLLAKNPNKKISFDYSPVRVSVRDRDSDRTLGDGSVPGFVHPIKNNTILKTDIVYNSQVEDAGALKAELKKNKGLKLIIEMNTKVSVRVGKMKTKRVGIRVTCGGITAAVPTGKAAAVAAAGKGKCDVDLRVKIWKWTF